MPWKCCTQCAIKFAKLSNVHRTGKDQFSFQSPKKAMAKDVQITSQLHSSHILAKSVQFNLLQSLSGIQLFATPWTTAHQASLSTITNSQNSPKPISIVSVMPSNHLILWHPLLLLSSIFPSIRVFSNESALCIRWPKYCSFSFNISPSSEHQDWFPLGWTGWISLQSKGLSRVFSKTTVQKHQFFSVQLSL